jgi:2-oxoglutarate ferredoxin oxidoreductase subunit alpha
VLVAEMSMGQMYEDVKMVAPERKQINFFGRGGGAVPSPEEVTAIAKRVLKDEELYFLGNPFGEEA